MLFPRVARRRQKVARVLEGGQRPAEGAEELASLRVAAPVHDDAQDGDARRGLACQRERRARRPHGDAAAAPRSDRIFGEERCTVDAQGARLDVEGAAAERGRVVLESRVRDDDGGLVAEHKRERAAAVRRPVPARHHRMERRRASAVERRESAAGAGDVGRRRRVVNVHDPERADPHGAAAVARHVRDGVDGPKLGTRLRADGNRAPAARQRGVRLKQGLVHDGAARLSRRDAAAVARDRHVADDAHRINAVGIGRGVERGLVFVKVERRRERAVRLGADALNAVLVDRLDERQAGL
mmetsp:Transcript_13276/g.46491  ORF Transcript_13276/g.46491 Transcript_13276/m.46491 type:complete len:298 (-) Transcript_13276:554-1447(-)